MIVWSFWAGLIVTLIGLVAFIICSMAAIGLSARRAVLARGRIDVRYALLGVALLVSGCGDDRSEPAGETPAPRSETSANDSGKEPADVDEEISDAAERGDDAAIKQAEGRKRELDGFDRLVGRLPIKQPPLRVQQTIQYGDSHRLFVAVRERDFLCDLAPSERRSAVADFYAKADRIFRAGGVTDFRMVLTRLQARIVNLERWAVAGPRGVRLTGAAQRPGC